jgi:uncharacterized protein with ParB-like and HNH nuclease domain
MEQSFNFIDDLVSEEDDNQLDSYQIEEYDLTSTPNDFNVLTINSFIQSGAIKIPGFQRNYVWDIKRASKLIESIILGLPVPQLFLYEENKNEFLVIDGQQRLMTIFYFIHQRFPRKEKRTELRKIFAKYDNLPEEILHDDDYFTPFKLQLPPSTTGHKNKFHNLTYKTLGESKLQFDLRPIRNVVVKQNVPKGDNSSVFEIFSRLNSGGVNLKPQEIRSCLYHSDFYNMIYNLNLDSRWRKLLRTEYPDLHMKDVEILLRGFAFMINGDKYSPSLAKFLNKFSQEVRIIQNDELAYLKNLFEAFLDSCSELDENAFVNKRSNRFNTFLFEALLYKTGKLHLKAKSLPIIKIQEEKLNLLLEDHDYASATVAGTTNSDNVNTRLSKALEIL